MKRCPKCNRAESDDSLAFCRTDGTRLVSDGGFVSEGAGTLRFDSAPVTGETETRILPTGEAPGRPTAPTTVLDGGQASNNTQGLSKPKSRKGLLIAVAAITAVTVAASAYFYLSRVKTGAARNSIAVLPFQNASGDPETEYLSDGISESLINSLSQLRNVRVLARSTMFSFKGKEANPQEVGKQLGVETVLTGRVVQRGDSLTVQADLVNVADGSQLWGERYSRKVSDLLAVQEDIAREISGKLRQRLSGEERERVSKRYTDDVEAYQLYLKGRYHLDKFDQVGFDKAVGFFNQAIGRDPKYALAYAGLSECYQLASGRSLPNKVAQPKARDAALKALELDDALAEAHSALGAVKMFYDWDFEGAEREYRRAIELNPNYGTAYKRYAFSYQAKGQTVEPLELLKKAHQLDPLSLNLGWELGYGYIYARQYDRAEEQFRKTLEIDPNFLAAREGLGWLYLHQGMYEKAIEEFRKAEQRDNSWSFGGLGRAYAESGNRGEALKVLDRLKARPSYVSPLSVANIYIGLGDKGAAFAWMNRGVEEKDDSLVFLPVDPVWDTLRSDPRFSDLVRRVGLAQ